MYLLYCFCLPCLVHLPFMATEDHSAYGSKAGKLRTCVRQRRAWDLNVKLIKEICTHVQAPLSPEIRFRGSDDTLQFVQGRARIYKQRGIETVEDTEAETEMSDAALDVLNRPPSVSFPHA